MLLKIQAQMVQMKTKIKIELKTETKMAMTVNKYKRIMKNDSKSGGAE